MLRNQISKIHAAAAQTQLLKVGFPFTSHEELGLLFMKYFSVDCCATQVRGVSRCYHCT